MKKKALTEVVFLVFSLALIILLIVFEFKGSDEKINKTVATNNADGESLGHKDANAYHQYILPSLNSSKKAVPQASNVGKSDKYAMQEPFALYNSLGLSHAMRKSIDPNTWMQLMVNMMNPQGTSSQAMCAACHDGPDLARYQQQFGPMLDAINPMMGMMNPNLLMMNQMMMYPMQMMMPFMSGFESPPQAIAPSNPPSPPSGIMSPEDYKKWYNDQQEKLNNSK